MITKTYTLNRISVINVPALRTVLRRYQDRGTLTFSEEKKGTRTLITVTAPDIFHKATTDFFAESNVKYEVNAS